MNIYRIVRTLVICIACLLPCGTVAAAPVDLSEAAQNALDQQVAVDSDGAAHTVWSRYDGANHIVQYRRVEADGTLGPTSDLSAAGQSAEIPQVAVDSDGVAHVVWRRFNGVLYIVQYRQVSAAGTLGATRDLSARAGGTSDYPQVTVDSSGRAHVVWHSFSAGHHIARYRQVAVDGTLGAILDLSAAGRDAIAPKVAVDPDGAAHVVWSGSDGSNQIAQYRRVGTGGALGATSVLSAAGQHATFLQVAVDSGGVAHVVWRRYDGSNDIVQYRRVAADGTLGTPRDMSAIGQHAGDPQVTVDSGGSAHVVWRRFDGSNHIAQYRQVGSEGTLGTTRDLSVAGQNALGSRVVVDSGGATRVVWRRYDGSNHIVQYRQVSPAGTMGATRDLSAAGENGVGPQVALDSGGAAHVVWRRFDGNHWIVQHERVEVDPPVTPTHLSFGNVDVSAGPASQVVTVSNETAEQATVVGTLSIEGVRSDAYSVTNECAAPIAPGDSCELTVYFDPAVTGAFPATLSVSVTGSATPVGVELAGTGVEAMPSLGPANLSFGNVGVSGELVSQAVTVSNDASATADAVVATPSIGGAGSGAYSVMNGCTAPIAPGGSCELSVSFNAAAAETFTAQLSVPVTGSVTPFTVDLSGTGVEAVPSVDPSRLAFGKVDVPAGAVSQVVTVSNAASASADAVVDTPSIDGTGSGAYSVANGCGAPLGPGDSCELSVAFDPTGRGTFVGRLSVSVSGAADPFTVDLSGTGIWPCPAGTSASVTCMPLTDVHVSRWRCSPAGAGGLLMLGTNAGERFVGTSAGDIILGRDGNDVVDAGGGNDTVYGQAGNDLLKGDYGDDCLHAGDGNDTASGGPGNDRVDGARGVDTLIGWTGIDVLLGGAGNDVIWAGSGDDRTSGGAGNDRIRAGSGDDRIFGGSGDDVLWGDAGNDVLIGWTGNDGIAGGPGHDYALGNDGNDYINGGLHADRIHGGAGNDIVLGGPGPDSEVRGGAGTDIVRW